MSSRFSYVLQTIFSEKTTCAVLTLSHLGLPGLVEMGRKWRWN